MQVEHQMHSYYKAGQKAHVRRWIREVAIFDEVPPTNLHRIIHFILLHTHQTQYWR